MRKFCFFLLMLCFSSGLFAQYSLGGTTYSQDFDGLGITTSTGVTGGNLNSVSASLNGWFFFEAGGTGQEVITAGTGSSATGDTYNFGLAADPSRTLGGLQSGTVIPSYGFYFTNNTGSTITSLAISYTGETWRVGAAGRSDRIDFQYSTNATSLSTGAWTDADVLDYSNPGQATGSGTLQHSAAVTNSITGLSLANGASFFIRWADVNATGSDDGIGINNFSFTATLSGAPAGAATITAGNVSAPATISSLINSSGAAATNFSFQINEDASADDANPALISQIIISQGANNNAALSNWTQAIAGAELSDGTNTVAGTVNATSITFAGLTNTLTTDIGYIADNGNKNYTLKIWLNASLGGSLPVTIDGKQFDFLIQTSGITTVGSGSSGIAPGQSQSAGLNTNVVTVVATKLIFVQNTTSPTGVNAAMTPAVTVSASDANNNRDLDFVASVRITSSGTLSGSPVDVAASAGLASFASLTHTATGTGLTLNAERTTTLDWDITSNAFDIQIASSASDYFRSAATGDWNTPGTWESSPDNNAWIPATQSPTDAANTITIRNLHTVTVSTNVTADQVDILNGGTLINQSITSNRLTVANGSSGDDIIIRNGAVYQVTSGLGYANYQTINAGATVKIETGGVIRIGSGGALGGSSNNSFVTTATTYIWDNGSIFDWNTTATPGATNVTYFPDASAAVIPVLRFSTAPTGNMGGGGGALTVNGVLEANASVVFTGNSDKVFRNGITGTGNVTQIAGTGKVIINGATAQLAGNGIVTLNASGLELGAATLLTLNGGKTLSGNILLNGGIIELGANNLVVSGDVTGASGTSYIKTNSTGSLVLNNIGAAARIFPVGNSTYNPLTIANGSGHDWSVNVNDNLIVSDPAFSTNVAKAVQRTWNITPSVNPPAGGADITFEYNDGNVSQIGGSFNTAENVQVWRKAGTDWIAAGGSQVPTGTAGGVRTVTITNWSNYSPFAISNISAPLPVNFSTVKATQQSGNIKVEWSNLTELDVIRYDIERSADGRNFASIGQVNARWNNGGKADYSFLDVQPFSGINYYRIRSLETGTKVKHSIIVKVDIRSGAAELVLYPNPVLSGQLSYQAVNLVKGKYTIRIFNAAGQQLYSRILNHAGGSVTEAIQLPLSARTGLYTLQLSSSDINFSRTFLIQ